MIFYFKDFFVVIILSLVSSICPVEEFHKPFYVHAPQKECKNPNQIKRIVNYVCRYAGHPAMSESRIIKYDKDNKMIHYYYDPHEDDAIINPDDKIGRQYVSESINEFIAKLIVHIPEENVHTTRYYGSYANHTNLDTKRKPKLF